MAKKENLLKNVLDCYRTRYKINELTIIVGKKVIFSGELDKFDSQCDVDMILYRNELLNSEVESESIFNSNVTKLFIFLNDKSANKLDKELKYGKI